MIQPQKDGLVSIITPAYNAASVLPETIDSVKAQTYENWEWWICDDCSTDGTADIVRHAGDSRIRLLSTGKHTGLAACGRNVGMKRSRGRFFAFLDADDLWEPEKLDRQVTYLQTRPDVDGVCCWYDVFGNEHQQARRSSMLNLRVDSVCRRSELIEGCPFQTSTVLFRRRCYDELGGMDEDPRLRSTEDYEYFARLISGYEFHRLPETLTHYRLSSSNGSYSEGTLDVSNERGWQLFEVMLEKGLYAPNEARRKRSYLYYEQAKDNLFHLHAPFRRHLVRSIASGCPPSKAVAMLALSVMPAGVVRGVLLQLGSVANRRRVRVARRLNSLSTGSFG